MSTWIGALYASPDFKLVGEVGGIKTELYATRGESKDGKSAILCMEPLIILESDNLKPILAGAYQTIVDSDEYFAYGRGMCFPAKRYTWGRQLNPRAEWNPLISEKYRQLHRILYNIGVGETEVRWNPVRSPIEGEVARATYENEVLGNVHVYRQEVVRNQFPTGEVEVDREVSILVQHTIPFISGGVNLPVVVHVLYGLNFLMLKDPSGTYEMYGYTPCYDFAGFFDVGSKEIDTVVLNR